MPALELGPIAPLIEAIPENLRPWVVTSATLLAAFSVAWQLVRPLGEAILGVSRTAAAAWRWAVKLIKPRKPLRPDGLPPEPIPDERTIWETRPLESPVYPRASKSGGVPIITVANMKGGVGKTTLTANLAAYFQSCFPKPILVIDFDYQGSLSETMLKHSGRDNELRAHTLITGRLPSEQAQAHARTLSHGLEKVEIFPARYPFATIENNLMTSWIKDQTQDDLRLRLCRLLRDDAFQGRYSMVLIDSPPRLTTGAINALCASTHLLVPTKLDELSAEAAVYFLQQVQRMQESLFPALNVIGIVPTMTEESRRLADFEERARDRLNLFGAETLRREDLVMMGQRVPSKSDIARAAGVGVAFLRRTAVQPIFEKLGREILERIK